jgi:hypothetical protein
MLKYYVRVQGPWPVVRVPLLRRFVRGARIPRRRPGTRTSSPLADRGPGSPPTD